MFGKVGDVSLLFAPALSFFLPVFSLFWILSIMKIEAFKRKNLPSSIVKKR